MARFIPKYYGSETEYVWTPDYQGKLNVALQEAVRHLDNALNDSLVADNAIIRDAIQRVKNVLNDQDLKNYPLTGGYYGQAQERLNQISINMDLLHDNAYVLAKTLIHEAFHIIGGFQGRTMDSTCDDNMPKDAAFSYMRKKRGISTMVADYFAQFVMQC